MRSNAAISSSTILLATDAQLSIVAMPSRNRKMVSSPIEEARQRSQNGRVIRFTPTTFDSERTALLKTKSYTV